MCSSTTAERQSSHRVTAHVAFDVAYRLGLCGIMAFAAQWHTPHNRCVRFAPAVAGDHATLATGRPLRLTRTGLSPAGQRQLSWRTSNPLAPRKRRLDCFVACAPRNDDTHSHSRDATRPSFAG